MRTKLALAALAFAVAATPLVLQQKETVNQLREQNRVLQQQIAQLEALRDESASPTNLKINATEVLRLRGEHAELLRLRGEVGRLRRTTMAGNAGPRPPLDAASGVGEVGHENIDKLALAEAMSQATADSAKQQGTAARTLAKQLGIAARIFATEHNDKFPATFDEMKNVLGGVVVDGFADAYEFVQHARPVSEREPDKLLFRERAPRQLPDGKWERVYTMCDGSVFAQISDDGNFEAWESAHLVKDAAEK